MIVKKVYELQPGESFIWLDRYTRTQMAVRYDVNRLQVLKCVYIDIKDGKINYSELNGECSDLYFDEGSKVIIVPAEQIDELLHFIHLGVICCNCNERYGSHYTGYGAAKEGICCGERNSGKWFVPDEQSLREYHPSAFEVEDFFATLGL